MPFPLLRIIASLVFLHVAGLDLCGDVIHLNDGSVLVVDKVWEEGNSVKYQTATGIKDLPKATVRRIQQQKSTAPTLTPTPKYGIAVETNSNSSGDRSQTQVPPMSGSAKEISEDVIRRLKENLKANPGDEQSRDQLITALNSQGSLQVLKGDLEAARITLQQAISLDKRNPALLMNLAIVQFRLGEYRMAEDVLLFVLQLDPKNQQAFYLLGETCYAQDKIPMAINSWKDAIRLGAYPAASSRLAKAEKEAGVHNELGALQSAHFILHYDRHVSDYRLGEQVLFVLERSYRQLNASLTSYPPATITVILYADQAYFDVTTAPQWSGGLFDGKIRLPIKGLSSITPEVSSVLTHELVHSFVAALSSGNCPVWFNEGLAQWQEGRSSSSQLRLLGQLAAEERLVPLTSLASSFAEFDAGAAGLAYLQSLSAIEYLSEKRGARAVRDILDLLRQNYNFPNAFQTVVGQTLPEFEKSWRTHLAQ
jgi:tetratricopeptide (TPR) repeat protein